jgi:bifunctional DNA-binding transcriptional regulator/antitoxin component of YhaV-PrlF toxin-antitoxin module
VAIRRKLSINPGNRVAFVIDDENGARVSRVEHDLRSLQGVIPTPPGLVTDDVDDLIEEAKADHADWVVQRMREGLE